MKKYNTASISPSDPLKSPSPDRITHNVLTPTQFKIGSYLQHDMHSSIQKSQPSLQNNEENLALKGEIKDLKSQNKRLMSIIEKYNQNHQSSSSAVPNRKNQQLIERIKEQYKQNINTLKQMVSQQIERCMDWVEEICRMMEKKISENQNRMKEIEKNLTEINMKRAEKSLQQLYKQTKNDLSEIVCQSIPEQSFEESRTQSFRHVDEAQIQIAKLQHTISELEESYKKEKEQFIGSISEKDRKIEELTELYKKQNSQQTKTMIKQLKQLKEDVEKMEEHVSSLQSEKKKFLKEIEEKNMERENMHREIHHLHEKVAGNQKHRAMLQEKNKYLSNNIQILENQLQERKKYTQQIMEKNFKFEREKHIETQPEREESKFILTNRIKQLLSKNLQKN